jgi:NAD(P)-dependent dehydrogenase (short-subunit alcohol dehydrogenase family)
MFNLAPTSVVGTKLPGRACRLMSEVEGLSRNLALVATLTEAGVEFVAVDMITHILAAVAEHERQAISERTKAALPAAKAHGKRLGIPKTIADAIAYLCFGFGPITAITRIIVGSTSTTSSSTPVNL